MIKCKHHDAMVKPSLNCIVSDVAKKIFYLICGQHKGQWYVAIPYCACNDIRYSSKTT